MRRVCIFHAGCPDGFGAAWAAWRAWGDEALYVARGHDDAFVPDAYTGDLLVFADIAPPPEAWRPLGELAARLVVLDHHVSARDRFEEEPGLADALARSGHDVRFDLDHSGAVLSWEHFHPDEPLPEILAYVEDQDLWRWKLSDSREVNAAIGIRQRSFEDWEEMARAPIANLAAEGGPIVRAQRIEAERALQQAHPLRLAGDRVEAVNAREQRAWIGHALAERARFGTPCGVVYRMVGTRVDVSLYSVGDFDVASLAARFGGGGHRNAAGFSVALVEWLERFL
jgi:hypothetical protein